jgi:hypothetical protein
MQGDEPEVVWKVLDVCGIERDAHESDQEVQTRQRL